MCAEKEYWRGRPCGSFNPLGSDILLAPGKHLLLRCRYDHQNGSCVYTNCRGGRESSQGRSHFIALKAQRELLAYPGAPLCFPRALLLQQILIEGGSTAFWNVFCNGAQNRHSLSPCNPFTAQLVNVANCWKWEMDSLMRPVLSWLYSPGPTPRHSFSSPPLTLPSQD